MSKTREILVLLVAMVLIVGCVPTATPTEIMASDTATALPPTATLIPPTSTQIPPSSTPSKYPMTIVDGAGRSVTIEAIPETIASLAPSNTEILYALGLGDLVVGVTEYCNYPPEAAEKPKIGGYSDVNIEVVTEVEPDLILAANIHITEVVPALEQLDLTVVVIDPADIPGVLDGITLVGEITDREEEAAMVVADMQTRIDAVSAAVEGREKSRTFWEISNDLWTAGPSSFINDLITRAGGDNIAADADSPWAQLSNEAIIEADPEVIFLADHPYGETKETLAERPGWDEISAIVNGRVIEVANTDIFSRPGPRVVDALEEAARALHPDAFE
jgi:iron complex transport system substrate-binding protein